MTFDLISCVQDYLMTLGQLSFNLTTSIVLDQIYFIIFIQLYSYTLVSHLNIITWV